MRLLSIDWDYFFPNALWYDWGHREAPFFMEAIWYTRCGQTNLKTGEKALDAYIPTVPENFWSLVTNRPQVIVADSHFRVWDLLAPGTEVTSLDAHHDCGYGNFKKMYQAHTIDCGNWGAWGQMTGKISKLRIYYPEWRRTDKEDKAHEMVRPIIHYGVPKPADYDLIFVCRSGAWTPPWRDPEFKAWLEQSGLELDPQENLVFRGPSLEEAREQAKLWTETIAGLKAGTVDSSNLNVMFASKSEEENRAVLFSKQANSHPSRP